MANTAGDTKAYEFHGWAGVDDRAVKGGMVFRKFEPKAWDEDDVDVKVQYCGICGSDVHALSGEWGPLDPNSPSFCGHEVVGEVVKVGSQVDGLKLGDIVGIGAQSDSCGECEWCQNDQEQVCPVGLTWTMGAPYRRGNAAKANSKSKGGFAKYWRGPAKFAIRIPSGLDPANAAPMFCGGITVYAPLEQYGAGTKARRVGVIGIGGLGHYGVLFAKAMGAEVTAISRTTDKETDAKKLGADKYLAMSDGIKASENSLDLIICTINPKDLDLSPYWALLRPYGTLCLVGISPKLSGLSCGNLIGGNRTLAGSNVGSPAQIKRMLKLAKESGIESWIQKYDMNDINQALMDFEEGKPRFRFVLVNADNGGNM